MLKQILVFCFFVSIVSSCKCNKDGKPVTDESTTTTTSMQANTDGTNTTGNKTDSAAVASANNTTTATGGNEQNTGKSLYKKGKGHENSGANTKGYFPEGSERLLTDKDLEFLSAWGYAVMKNEIFARHGMIFSAGMLKDHFEKQSWYHATTTSVKGKLSNIEKSNLAFMENYKDKPAPENGD